ncbi:MAG TPA: lytic transglycosylase domain-containing protein [Thermoanaerobaculia bacterium]|nr:lytic transglycosylase domain-containing protein [Thermoanaerobaculia bacterium]
MRKAWGIGALGALWAMSLGAEVRVGVLSDGSKIIYGEGRAHRERRLSARLVAPQADLAAIIDQHATSRRLDPKLVQAVIQVESGYNARARSNKGAMGLMQLMPGTAKELAVANPYDASQNVLGGTAYLRQLLDLFDDQVELALAAYNAGPGAVRKYGGIPPYAETTAYVRRIVGLYRGEEASLRIGTLARPVYTTRDPSGRILLTTSGPR